MIKKILISQPAPKTAKSPYFDLEQKYNIKIDFQQLIHTERYTEKEFRAQRVNILEHTAIIFSSHHAIDSFFAICKDMRITMPEEMKYFFVSEKIALYIQKYIQYRKRKIFYAKTGKWDELLDLLVKHKKEFFLFPQNEVHHHNMSEDMEARGLKHTECNMFRTVSSQLDKDKPFDYDMIVFFTPSGVKSVTDNFPDYKQGKTLFACWGDAAAKEIEARNYRLDLKAPTAEATSMPAALDIFLEGKVEKREE